MPKRSMARDRRFPQSRRDSARPRPATPTDFLDAPFGLFARQKIKAMAGRKLIAAAPAIDESQFQPASLDLRLGKEAYRVRASFLPGRGRTVVERLKSLNAERVSLTGEGAVLEKGIVYVAPLIESLALAGASFPAPPTRRARPAGSTSSPA